MTEKEKVDQENVNNFTETINDAGIIGDEAPGKVALGRYLCTCVESQGMMSLKDLSKQV